MDVLARLGLALGMGLWMSFDRGWPGREVGSRTFGLIALVGGITGLFGTEFAALGFGIVGVLIVLLNLQALRTKRPVQLTSAAALLVTFLVGLLAGLDHRVVPVALSLATVVLLSSKAQIAQLRGILSVEEIRSATLVAVLALAVYPVLPDYPIDRYGLIAPRGVWLTVLLIAGLGFVSFVLWKVFGKRSLALETFLGGLVDSTKVVSELSARVAEVGTIHLDGAYRGVLLAVGAMVLRNTVLFGLLQPEALLTAGPPLVLMGIISVFFALRGFRDEPRGEADGPLTLRSPFSLKAVLRSGAIYLMLQIATTLAHGQLGAVGFYAMCVVGGTASSASTVAVAAAMVASGAVPSSMAGIGAILASITSLGVSVVLVARTSRSSALLRRISVAAVTVQTLGLAAALAVAVLDART